MAEGVVCAAPLGAAGDPWACVCVVCAGEFCDENFELMLFIHEPRRDMPLPSGAAVPLTFLSLLPRLSSVGRLGGAIFWVGVVNVGGAAAAAVVVAAAGGGRGGDAGLVAAGSGS